jgi:hypothetical protein
MIKNLIIGFYFALFPGGLNVANNIIPVRETVISSREMSLNNRYPVASVSEVFKDNILLNLAYLDGRVGNASDINWTEITKSFKTEFVLQPNEVFAYHDAVFPEYEGLVVKTTEAHFNSQDGFRSSGYLYGDGVCHLASLINWAAQDAKLDVVVPSNHNFAVIPEIPKEYGVSIYYMPNNSAVGAQKNLYIKNNQDTPVKFVFVYQDGDLSVSVISLA